MGSRSGTVDFFCTKLVYEHSDCMVRADFFFLNLYSELDTGHENNTFCLVIPKLGLIPKRC